MTTEIDFKNTQLIQAVINNQEKPILALLQNGVDVNLSDKNGQTPLMWAVWQGNNNLVKLLLLNGADVNIADQQGWTALRYAEELEEPEIAELLKNGVSTVVQTQPTVIQELTPYPIVFLPQKDWRDAVTIGTLIGGSVIILIGLANPQIKQQVTNSSSNSTSSNSSVTSSSISEQDAVNIIQNWFKAKREIFAPPYNRELAAELTTDTLYHDIIKPDGSIDWLVSKNAYYTFGVQKVEPTGTFVLSGDSATVEVKVTEELTLYINGRIDDTQTGFEKRLVRYSLRFADGRWKIVDYKRISQER